MNKENTRSELDDVTTLGHSRMRSWLIAKFKGQTLTQEEVERTIGYRLGDYPAFNTTWRAWLSSDIVYDDTVGTHFLGWENNKKLPMTLTNSGAVKLKAKYSYDFPMDLIVFDYPPEDQLSIKTAFYLMKLAGNKVFQNLSVNYAPRLVAEISMNSANCLSDVVLSNLTFTDPDFSLESLPDDTLLGDDGIYMAGNYGFVEDELLRQQQQSDSGYNVELLNSMIELARDMYHIENYDVVLSAHPSHRLPIVPKYQKITDVTLTVVPPAEENCYKVWQHTLGEIDNGGGDEFYGIHILDFDKPVCNSLIIAEGKALLPDDFTIFAERPYAVFATGDEFTNLVVWATGEEIHVHNSRTGNAREEKTIDEFLSSKVNEAELNVEFKLDKVGNSINFNYVLMDERPNAVEDVDLESRQYLETVIYAETRQLDGINTAPLADRFGLDPNSIKSTKETRFGDIISSCNISIAEESEYSIAGVINLDDPTVLYDLESCYIYGMDEHGFKVNAPMNVCLVYVKNA